MPASFSSHMQPKPGEMQGHPLPCPLCGDDHVHVDGVEVGGRDREDGAPCYVRVDSAARVHVVPTPPEQTAGRRHTITLTGWCETCDRAFAIALQQHKGQTLTRDHRAPHVHYSGPRTSYGRRRG